MGGREGGFFENVRVCGNQSSLGLRLGQWGVMGGGRVTGVPGRREGGPGPAGPSSLALSFTHIITMPILQTKTETQRAVLQGCRLWKTLKRTLPSPTPPSVSNSPPPFFLLSPPELATIWTWDPRSLWDAAATSLSMDRMQPGSVKATWTVRHTSVPSPHPPQRPEWPRSPAPWKSFFRANHGLCLYCSSWGSVWNRKASKSLSKCSRGWAVSRVRGVSDRCWDTSRSLTFSVFLNFPHSCRLASACLLPTCLDSSHPPHPSGLSALLGWTQCWTKVRW